MLRSLASLGASGKLIFSTLMPILYWNLQRMEGGGGGGEVLKLTSAGSKSVKTILNCHFRDLSQTFFWGPGFTMSQETCTLMVCSSPKHILVLSMRL